jgi:hypothetical protein
VFAQTFGVLMNGTLVELVGTSARIGTTRAHTCDLDQLAQAFRRDGDRDAVQCLLHAVELAGADGRGGEGRGDAGLGGLDLRDLGLGEALRRPPARSVVGGRALHRLGVNDRRRRIGQLDHHLNAAVVGGCGPFEAGDRLGRRGGLELDGGRRRQVATRGAAVRRG